jgi:uncharacterized membrane protein
VRLRAAIAALAVAGLGIAVYLTVLHYAHASPICVNGGCEKVQKSSYSELAGVPVALLGVIAYAVLIACAALRGATAALIGAATAIVGLAFSIYLLWAQLGPIGAVCQWCLANDAMMLALAVLSTVRALREE